MDLPVCRSGAGHSVGCILGHLFCERRKESFAGFSEERAFLHTFFPDTSGVYLLPELSPVRESGGCFSFQPGLHCHGTRESALYVSVSCIDCSRASVFFSLVPVDAESQADSLLPGIFARWETSQHCGVCKSHDLLGRAALCSGSSIYKFPTQGVDCCILAGCVFIRAPALGVYYQTDV